MINWTFQETQCQIDSILNNELHVFWIGQFFERIDDRLQFGHRQKGEESPGVTVGQNDCYQQPSTNQNVTRTRS